MYRTPKRKSKYDYYLHDTTSLNTPLETIAPDVFDPLDKEQEYAIEHGMTNVVLTENANDIVRSFLNNDIPYKYRPKIGRRKPTNMLDIILFKDIIKASGRKGLRGIPNVAIEFRNINEFAGHFSFLKRPTKDSHAIGILGLDLKELGETDEYGGHYCAYIIDLEAKVIGYFDPMCDSVYSDPDEEISFPHYLRSMLNKVLGDKESKKYNIEQEMKFSKLECAQSTGGFNNSPPQFVEYYRELYKDKETMEDIREFGVDSQNHFCYMWSLFYLYINFVYEDDESNNYLQSIGNGISDLTLIPLALIKLFIHYIIMRNIDMFNVFELGSIPNDYIQKFYNTHFLRVFYWAMHDSEDQLGIRYDKICSDKVLRDLDTEMRFPNFDDLIMIGYDGKYRSIRSSSSSSSPSW